MTVAVVISFIVATLKRHMQPEQKLTATVTAIATTVGQGGGRRSIDFLEGRFHSNVKRRSEFECHLPASCLRGHQPSYVQTSIKMSLDKNNHQRLVLKPLRIKLKPGKALSLT